MRCPECGFDNPDDTKFCTNCGTKLEAAASSPTPTAPTSFCPQCGAQIRPEARFCDQCGQDLKQATTRVASAPPQVERAFPLPNVIAAGVGAVMMLVSLAIPWYTIRYLGASSDVSASDLLTETGNGGPIWAGSALPLILMIIFASLVLLSVLFSIWKKVATKSLWASLGTVCTLCVVGNAGYILWWLHDSPWYGGAWINIVQAGSALAFAGALVVSFSGICGRSTAQGQT